MDTALSVFRIAVDSFGLQGEPSLALDIDCSQYLVSPLSKEFPSSSLNMIMLPQNKTVAVQVSWLSRTLIILTSSCYGSIMCAGRMQIMEDGGGDSSGLHSPVLSPTTFLCDYYYGKVMTSKASGPLTNEMAKRADGLLCVSVGAPACWVLKLAAAMLRSDRVVLLVVLNRLPRCSAINRNDLLDGRGRLGSPSRQSVCCVLWEQTLGGGG